MIYFIYYMDIIITRPTVVRVFYTRSRYRYCNGNYNVNKSLKKVGCMWVQCIDMLYNRCRGGHYNERLEFEYNDVKLLYTKNKYYF